MTFAVRHCVTLFVFGVLSLINFQSHAETTTSIFLKMGKVYYPESRYMDEPQPTVDKWDTHRVSRPSSRVSAITISDAVP
jgi:hypothetical protein